MLNKEKVTILQTVDPEMLKASTTCLAVYPATGMWYECCIESKLSVEESESFAATDMRNNQIRYRVKYTQFDDKKMVPLDYIRLTQE